MEYLFSYGTLQKEKVQQELFGRILKSTPDSLIGYKISTVEITDESFLSRGENKFQQTLIISNDNNDCINGTALELTGEELLAADNYEPEGYKRTQVTLKSGKQAWIYILT
jgi:gamma-glutamylcyclotransferase (GGCT)/AIG2-like uncharacterized protein YtfP